MHPAIPLQITQRIIVKRVKWTVERGAVISIVWMGAMGGIMGDTICGIHQALAIRSTLPLSLPLFQAIVTIIIIIRQEMVKMSAVISIL